MFQAVFRMNKFWRLEISLHSWDSGMQNSREMMKNHCLGRGWICWCVFLVLYLPVTDRFLYIRICKGGSHEKNRSWFVTNDWFPVSLTLHIELCSSDYWMLYHYKHMDTYAYATIILRWALVYISFWIYAYMHYIFYIPHLNCTVYG